MSYEKGGRATKFGSKYEELYVIYELLNIVLEINTSVLYEPLGLDEEGVDLIVTSNSERNFLQCKSRNSSKEYWEFNDLKNRKIFAKWGGHLLRDENVNVGLVSPLACTLLEDIIKRSLNTPDFNSFLQFQIEKSNAETQKFYFELIKHLNIENKTECVLPFLNRIKLMQISEAYIEKSIDLIIRVKFENNPKQVKDALFSFIKNENIYGREVDIYELNRYFNENDIRYIQLSNSIQNVEAINQLNHNFAQYYTAINNTIIERDETNKVISNILNGNNVVVHGAAGYGKSGVLQHTIIKLNEMSIPYLSINLADSRLDSSFETFYVDLGLKKSPAICIDAIKKNGPVVLVFDQLDSIKWINSKSKTCVQNLLRVLKDVEQLNKKRDERCKISIIVSCRSYDLDNDRLLKDIFDESWVKILVNKMNYDNILKYVDNGISKEFIETLRIPNNLFIYLNIKNKLNVVNGTSMKLIQEWINQICRGSKLSNNDIRNEIYKIVNKMNELQVLSLNNNILDVNDSVLEYLISENLIIRVNNKIVFTHQTTYDYLISKKIFDDYISTEEIKKIIPHKNCQTPIERYKLQMFIDRLLDYDEKTFIRFSEQFLKSKKVRCYYKHLISEILGSIVEPSDAILEYVTCNFANHFIYNACIRNKVFARKIRHKLAKIPLNTFNKNFFIKSLRFTRGDIEDSDITDVLCLNNSDINKEMYDSLGDDFYYDSKIMFDFRYKYMLENNEFGNIYIGDMNKALEINAVYTSYLIELLFLKNIKNLNFYNEEKLTIQTLSNPIQVFEILIKCIPSTNSVYDDWTYSHYSHNIQRLIVSIIKICNNTLVESHFEHYFQLYDNNISSNSYVMNELFLDFLSKNNNVNNSSYIMQYVSNNIDFTLEHSSGKSKIYYLSLILKNNLKNLNKLELEKALDAIYYYKPQNIVSYYSLRKGFSSVFWGQLQHDIFNIIDDNLLNKKCLELKKVLNRRTPKGSFYSDFHSSYGSVVSPVYNKKLSDDKWIKIVNNGNEISKREKTLNMNKEGFFVESNINSFSDDFINVVKQNPIFYIDYFSRCKRNIHRKFINAFFYGISDYTLSEVIDKNIIHNIISYYVDDSIETERVKSCLNFLNKNRSYVNVDIVTYLFRIVVKTKKDYGSLNYEMYKLNSTYGEFSILVSNYLWETKEMDSVLANIIDYYYNNEDINIRFCSLEILAPILNINKAYSIERILELLKEPRMFNSYNITRLISYIYKGNENHINRCIKNVFKKHKENDEAKKLALYSAIEIYIHKGYLKNIVCDKVIKKEHYHNVIEMLDAYENYYDEYSRLKKLLYHYSDEAQYLVCKLIKNKKISIVKDEKIVKYAFFNYKKRGLKLFEYIDDLEYEFYEKFVNQVIGYSKNILKEDYFSKEEYAKIIMQLYEKYQNDNKLSKKLLDVIDLLYCDGCAINIVREYLKS